VQDYSLKKCISQHYIFQCPENPPDKSIPNYLYIQESLYIFGHLRISNRTYVRTIRDTSKQAINATILILNNSYHYDKACFTFTVLNSIVIGDILTFVLIRMRKNSLLQCAVHKIDYKVKALSSALAVHCGWSMVGVVLAKVSSSKMFCQ